jgi:hypothetical protein
MADYYTDADGNKFIIDPVSGKKVYQTSSEQQAVNAAWIKYWNDPTGNTPRPLEGTFYTGTSLYSPEGPDAATRQKALDFFGGGTVKATTTTPLLGMPQVTPDNYSAVSAANGGLTTVTAGQTIAIPASLKPMAHALEEPAPRSPSTNALNAAAGQGQGASGNMSTFTRNSVLDKDYPSVPSKPSVLDKRTAEYKANAAGNVGVMRVVNGVQEFAKPGETYTMTPGNHPIPAPIPVPVQPALNTGFAFTKTTGTGEQQPLPPPPVANAAVGDIAPHVNAIVLDKNMLVNNPDMKQPIQTTDEYIQKNFTQRDIQTIRDLRLTATSGEPLPDQILLTIALAAFGEGGLKAMLSATNPNNTNAGGQWVIQNQSIVWKENTIPTPTTMGNGNYYNGVGSGNYVAPSSGGGGGNGQSNSGGIASTIVSMRLSTG